VRQLLAEIDARELTEWMAYDALDPIGDERGDWRAGIIAATVANRHRNKGETVHKPSDFVPRFGEPERPTQEQLIEKAKLFALMMGGEFR
jgi:hypothetical protein